MSQKKKKQQNNLAASSGLWLDLYMDSTVCIADQLQDTSVFLAPLLSWQQVLYFCKILGSNFFYSNPFICILCMPSLELEENCTDLLAIEKE